MQSLLRFLRSGRGLRTYAAVVLGFMILVIVWGAVVRATGSGAGCGNHWPLCNGDFVPHHPRFQTIIEFTHRTTSGACTALYIGLLLWILQARPKGDPARRAAYATGGMLVVEAFLGAMLVKGGFVEGNASNLRVLMQCVHFTSTMLLLGAFGLTWVRLAPTDRLPYRDAAESAGSGERQTLVWLALLTTLVVGATGSVAALADTLFPAPSLRGALAQDLSASAPLLVHMRLLHPLAAGFGAICVAWLCLRVRSRASRVLAALLALQILLGSADVLLLAPLWLQLLHLFVADLYWLALVALSANLLASPMPARARASEFALTA